MAAAAVEVGDSRLTVMGTDGYIEVRPNVDLAGRPGGSHLFLVDQKETRYIDAKDTPLPVSWCAHRPPSEISRLRRSSTSTASPWPIMRAPNARDIVGTSARSQVPTVIDGCDSMRPISLSSKPEIIWRPGA